MVIYILFQCCKCNTKRRLHLYSCSINSYDNTAKLCEHFNIKYSYTCHWGFFTLGWKIILEVKVQCRKCNHEYYNFGEKTFNSNYYEFDDHHVCCFNVFTYYVTGYNYANDGKGLLLQEKQNELEEAYIKEQQKKIEEEIEYRRKIKRQEEIKKQKELKMIQERKRIQKEQERKRIQEEMERKRRQEEMEKEKVKRIQEIRKQNELRIQKEQERKRIREEMERKRIQEEMERKRKQEEIEKEKIEISKIMEEQRKEKRQIYQLYNCNMDYIDIELNHLLNSIDFKLNSELISRNFEKLDKNIDFQITKFYNN